MMDSGTNVWLWELAKKMALAVNGGDWETDYTQAQRRGWYLKAAWAVDEFTDEKTNLRLAKEVLAGAEVET